MKLATRLAILAAAAASIPACGGSSGGGDTPSAGGGLQILARGGTGTTGAGGNGSGFSINAYNAAGIQILRSGTVNTAVNVPVVMPDLGAHPRIITSNTEITPPLGTWEATIPGDDLQPATGLWVKPGVTLEIRAHYDNDNADNDFNTGTGTFEWVTIGFSASIYVEGTLLFGPQDLSNEGDHASRNGADTYVYVDSVVVSASGRIDSSGADAPAGSNGGSGGPLALIAAGSIINAGTIDSSGGNGDAGGSGGRLSLGADYGVYSTGILTASGGAGSNGPGGAAGYQELLGANDNWGGIHGGVFNLGTVTSTGGDGTTGGGAGNNVYMSGNTEGATLNSGTVDSSGGDATLSGSGGDAGRIMLDSYSGSVRAGGTLTVRGGNGPGGGGDGGEVFFQVSPGGSVVNGPVNGGVFVGAAIDACGGAGATGGAGGYVHVYANRGAGNPPGTDPIMLVGYGTIDISGGDGTIGGYSDDVTIISSGAEDDNGTFRVGGIVNEANWIAHGGRGTTGGGGIGSLMLIETFPYNFSAVALTPNVPDFSRSVANYGTLDLSGGDGGTTGGGAGSLAMSDYFKVLNSGAIVGVGGTGGSGPGGSGGLITLWSDDVVTNTASIAVDGGAGGSGTGGSGQYIHFYARTTTTSGDLSCRGGSSGTGGGGDGGTIGMFSTENGTAVSGAFGVAGGTGMSAGAVGHVVIDGIDIELTNGTIAF